MNTVSSLRVNGLSSYNNNLYFLAHHLLDGFGLYQLNTNDFSVSIVKTINPNGTNQTREGIIVRLNKMIFKAEAAKGEMETWVSDGTADGTKVLFDPYLSAGNSTDLLATNSTHLFFRGWDGVENKIWKSDAISAFPLETPFQVFSAIAHNDVVYFLGKDMVSLLSGLYNFDGSRFVLLKSFVGNNLYEIISHKGKMYFSMVQTGVDSESVTQLWVSDGTEAGTRILKSISKVASEDGIWGLSSSGDGHFYFILDDVDHGEELWVSDGTEAGTHIVVDLNPGIAKGTGSNPMKLIRQYDP